MKKVFLLGLTIVSLSMYSCTNSNQQSDANTHTHDDGSVHGAHTIDTIMPNQQEFIVEDTAQKEPSEGHIHQDGEIHSH